MQTTFTLRENKSTLISAHTVHRFVTGSVFIGIWMLHNVCTAQEPFATLVNGFYSTQVVQTHDDGFVVSGYTTEFYYERGSDACLLKFDSLGSLEWCQVLDGWLGVGYWDDEATAVVQTSDSGYVITGVTNGYYWAGYEDGDILLARFNGDGEFQWGRALGGAGFDGGDCIINTVDGGFVVAGSTFNFGGGALLIKIDGSGVVEWTRIVKGTSPSELIQAADGGFVLAGGQWNVTQGVSDLFVIKFNHLGEYEWSNAVGGGKTDSGVSVIEEADGGYLIVGYTWSFETDGDDFGKILIVRMSGDGDLEWARVVGGARSYRGYSVTQDGTGGYRVWGKAYDYNGINLDQVFLMKFNSAWELKRTDLVGGVSSLNNVLVLPDDHDYVLSGFSDQIEEENRGLLLLTIDTLASGCLDGEAISETPKVAVVYPAVRMTTPVIESPDLLQASLTPMVERVDPTVTDLCMLLGVDDQSGKVFPELIDVWPNPFSTHCTISAPAGAMIEIYDFSGRVVERFQMPAWSEAVSWTPNEYLTSGIYLVKAEMNNGLIETQQAIFLR